MHSEYKFPRTCILVMFLTLVGVVMAIESARNVAAGDSDPVTIMSIARVVFAGFAAMGIAGALGYGLLRFFRRSGAR